MTTHSATMVLLRETASSGPSSLAKVATYLLSDPVVRARLTIGSIAKATQTSPATVTRLARYIGLAGYKDLRVALAAASAASSSETVLPGISWSDSPADVLQNLAAQERRTLRETARMINPQALADAAKIVASAHRLLIFGLGASGLVGDDLGSKLARIGIFAHVSNDRHDALALSTTLAKQDAAIFISHSGSTTDILHTAQAVHDRSHTLCIVSRSATPLATLCDVVLRTSPGPETDIRPGATSSRIGQMFACDALSIAVMQTNPNRSRQLLTTTRSAVGALH